MRQGERDPLLRKDRRRCTLWGIFCYGVCLCVMVTLLAISFVETEDRDVPKPDPGACCVTYVSGALACFEGTSINDCARYCDAEACESAVFAENGACTDTCPAVLNTTACCFVTLPSGADTCTNNLETFDSCTVANGVYTPNAICNTQTFCDPLPRPFECSCANVVPNITIISNISPANDIIGGARIATPSIFLTDGRSLSCLGAFFTWTFSLQDADTNESIAFLPATTLFDNCTSPSLDTYTCRFPSFATDVRGGFQSFYFFSPAPTSIRFVTQSLIFDDGGDDVQPCIDTPIVHTSRQAFTFSRLSDACTETPACPTFAPVVQFCGIAGHTFNGSCVLGALFLNESTRAIGGEAVCAAPTSANYELCSCNTTCRCVDESLVLLECDGGSNESFCQCTDGVFNDNVSTAVIDVTSSCVDDVFPLVNLTFLYTDSRASACGPIDVGGVFRALVNGTLIGARDGKEPIGIGLINGVGCSFSGLSPYSGLCNYSGSLPTYTITDAAVFIEFPHVYSGALLELDHSMPCRNQSTFIQLPTCTGTTPAPPPPPTPSPTALPVASCCLERAGESFCIDGIFSGLGCTLEGIIFGANTTTFTDGVACADTPTCPGASTPQSNAFGCCQFPDYCTNDYNESTCLVAPVTYLENAMCSATGACTTTAPTPPPTPEPTPEPTPAPTILPVCDDNPVCPIPRPDVTIVVACNETLSGTCNVSTGLCSGSGDVGGCESPTCSIAGPAAPCNCTCGCQYFDEALPMGERVVASDCVRSDGPTLCTDEPCLVSGSEFVVAQCGVFELGGFCNATTVFCTADGLDGATLECLSSDCSVSSGGDPCTCDCACKVFDPSLPTGQQDITRNCGNVF